MLTFHWCGPVAFAEWQFHCNSSIDQLLKYIWILHFYNHSHIAQGPMSKMILEDIIKTIHHRNRKKKKKRKKTNHKLVHRFLDILLIYPWTVLSLVQLMLCCIFLIMTSSNRNIFRVTGPLWGNLLATGGYPSQRASNTRVNVFLNVSLNKRFSKRPSARDLRRHGGHCDVTVMSPDHYMYQSSQMANMIIRIECKQKWNQNTNQIHLNVSWHSQ